MVLTRSDVENALSGKGDFVKIDHLNRFLREADSMDIRKFILLKLAGIYEERNFYLDAAKHISAAADMAITYKEKIELYLRETELYIKIGKFDMADKAFTKAHLLGNTMERVETERKYFGFYENQAKQNDKSLQHRKTIELYEKMLSMNFSEDRKTEIKNKLMILYNKLGKIRDYNRVSNIRIETPKVHKEPEIEPGSFEDLGIRRF